MSGGNEETVAVPPAVVLHLLPASMNILVIPTTFESQELIDKTTILLQISAFMIMLEVIAVISAVINVVFAPITIGSLILSLCGLGLNIIAFDVGRKSALLPFEKACGINYIQNFMMIQVYTIIVSLVATIWMTLEEFETNNGALLTAAVCTFITLILAIACLVMMSKVSELAHAQTSHYSTI